MKSLHFLILSALLATNSKAICHTAENTAKEEQTKNVSLQIKGLFKEYTQHWYIPESHVIILTLLPAPNGGMYVEDIETKNHKLAKSLLESMFHKHIEINGTKPIKIRVNLTH